MIIRQLAKLEANQKEMLKTLNGLVFRSNQSSGEADCEYFASLPRFPISTEAELKLFDEYLREEDNLERAVHEINNSNHFWLRHLHNFLIPTNFCFRQSIFRLSVVYQRSRLSEKF